MSTIGKRLLEERKRFKMNQTEFGSLGGVSKTTQLNYEAGSVSPDANYLSGIAAAGADLIYIITGVRQSDKPLTHEMLSIKEKDIIETWAALDEDSRTRLLYELDRVRQEAELKRKIIEMESRIGISNSEMVFHAPVNNAAGRDITINKK